ncbi:Uncharacterized protein TCAP_06490, partial [Tolypocladium capitatum]
VHKHLDDIPGHVAIAEWTILQHPPGVIILWSWVPAISHVAKLSQYTGFAHPKDVSSFCDNIVADIAGTALLVAHAKFTNNALKNAISQSDQV